MVLVAPQTLGALRVLLAAELQAVGQRCVHGPHRGPGLVVRRHLRVTETRMRGRGRCLRRVLAFRDTADSHAAAFPGRTLKREIGRMVLDSGLRGGRAAGEDWGGVVVEEEQRAWRGGSDLAPVARQRSVSDLEVLHGLLVGRPPARVHGHSPRSPAEGHTLRRTASH